MEGLCEPCKTLAHAKCRLASQKLALQTHAQSWLLRLSWQNQVPPLQTRNAERERERRESSLVDGETEIRAK